METSKTDYKDIPQQVTTEEDETKAATVKPKQQRGIAGAEKQEAKRLRHEQLLAVLNKLVEKLDK